MTLKHAVMGGAAALVLAGAIYWGVHEPTEKSAQSQVIEAPHATPADEAKPAAAQSHDVVGQRIVIPTAPAGVPAPVATPEILPVEISDPKDYVTLQGSVVDANNIPIEGAEVHVAALGIPRAPEGSNDDVLSAHRAAYSKYMGKRDHYWNGVTDETGQFVVKDIRFAGMTVITGRAPGYLAAIKYIALDDSNTPRENITLQLQPGVTVYGLLLSAAGQPVIDGSVQVIGFFAAGTAPMGNRSVGLVSLTDDSGHFELDIEGPGMLSLGAESEMHGATTFSDVAANPDEELVLRYPQPADVFGVVQDSDGRAVPDAQVQLEGIVTTYGGGPAAVGAALTAKPDASGSYRIANVDPGQRYVTKVVGTNGALLAEGEPIEQLVAGTDYELNFTVTPQMTVRGTIYGTLSGEPLDGISVAAVPNDENRSQAGGAVIHRVMSAPSGPKGAYSLTLTGAGGSFTLAASYSGSAHINAGVDLSDMPTVTLEPGKTITQDIGVVEPVTRSFALVDESGNPVAGAATAVDLRLGNSNMSYGTSVGTDAEGRVTISGLPSSKQFAVSFLKSGYVRVQSTVAAGEPGETMPEEVVVMYRATAARVMVINPDGTPIANQPIDVHVAYGEHGTLKDSVNTDADGYATIPAVLPATEATIQFFVPIERDGVPTESSSRADTYTLVADTLNELGQVTVAPVSN